jgi:Ca2+-binding RTX toxin-like protein
VNKMRAGNCTGTSKNDRLVGGARANVIHAAGGNNRVYGNGGEDWLKGGTGQDVLYGDEDNDRVKDHMGADTVFGGRGDRGPRIRNPARGHGRQDQRRGARRH